MTKKKMWWITGLYTLCALIGTTNFFLHWHQDGMVNFSTGLFGLSAVLFAVAAVGSAMQLIRAYKADKEEK